MKIGLLAYHSAINFGATLQLLSTYCYLKNHGHQPIIINWVAPDLASCYHQGSPSSQQRDHQALRKHIWSETRLCQCDRDVADVILSESIESVIIGSDAVCQHHTLRERLVFPCRKIIGVEPVTSDRVFPNPFWATWLRLLPSPIPVAVLSASNQDSQYKYFPRKLRQAMAAQVKTYSYLSVRDTWTRDMFVHITDGTICPDVTPDPVFAFENNAKSLIPSREEILSRFGLPEKYLLFSFINSTTVDQQWIDDMQTIAGHNGYTCVKLPFSDKNGFGEYDTKIELPLSPLDWFALIKYSCGYIGHNMHPIVVSIHTNTPFFSFDNYGLKRFNGLLPTDKSSKIKHILETAELNNWRVSCISKRFQAPAAEAVFRKLMAFDKDKSKAFADAYYAKYLSMMDAIISSLPHNGNPNKR